MKTVAAARQGGAFLLIGALATGVHIATALTARGVFQLAPLAANFVGYACAVGVSYLGNARLTFRKPTADIGQFTRFLVVSLLGLALNQGIIFALVERAHLPFWLALGPVVVLVPLMSFALMKVWAFGERGLRTGRVAAGD